MRGDRADGISAGGISGVDSVDSPADGVLAALTRCRIVPVVVIDDAGRAPDLVRALADGGIRCAEITLRTSAGLAAIAAAAETLDASDMLIGAGTVLTPDDVEACADAGARFVVSPGFDDEVVERALTLGITPLPGIATATELQRALRRGLDAVKLFPADRLGGLPAIAALSAPFPSMRFMPSGGVNPSNVLEYLAHPAVFAAGGSWMVPRSSIADGDFDTIRRLSEAASALVR